MTFLWPEMLWLLLLLPLLAVSYVLLLRRRKRHAVRFANLGLVREAMGAARWRRHVPPLLLLLALTALVLAIARPAAMVTLPTQHETVVLAMDVSRSMQAADVEPNRLAAAQAAARAFVAEVPRSTRLAVVAFAGTASMVQAPTANRDDVLAAIDRFELQRATAVGSGILVALKAIFPDIEFDLSSSDPRPVGPGKPTLGVPLGQAPKNDAAAEFKPVEPGSYKSAAIILLTDGQTTTGPNPIESARMAAERGVRVFTVGIGTPNGELLGAEGWSMRVRLDEDSLKTIANLTRAEYFYAGTAQDLKKVYQSLNSKFVLEKKETEITAVFAAAGALLAALGGLLSLLWFNRVL